MQKANFFTECQEFRLGAVVLEFWCCITAIRAKSISQAGVHVIILVKKNMKCYKIVNKNIIWMKEMLYMEKIYLWKIWTQNVHMISFERNWILDEITGIWPYFWNVQNK